MLYQFHSEVEGNEGAVGLIYENSTTEKHNFAFWHLAGYFFWEQILEAEMNVHSSLYTHFAPKLIGTD